MQYTANGDEREHQGQRMRRDLRTQFPPRIQFDEAIRKEAKDQVELLNDFEAMTAMLEVHPIVPFEECSFGSDLLDTRRALAYHIITRQLGHARSLIVNANIKNRTGTGVALRCMLEMTAFAEYFLDENRLNDEQLINRYLDGQAFLGGNWAVGSWYELEEVWKEKFGQPLPENAKKFFKAVYGLPKGGEFLKPAISKDDGFAYMYSRYSEYVHPAFTRPKDDIEESLGIENPHHCGSKQYYSHEVKEGAPLQLILRDVSAGVFCLECFWSNALGIDPHFDEATRPIIVAILEKTYPEEV